MGQSNCCASNSNSFIENQSKEAPSEKECNEVRTLESKKSRRGSILRSQALCNLKSEDELPKKVGLKKNQTEQPRTQQFKNFSESLYKEYASVRKSKKTSVKEKPTKYIKKQGKCQALVLRYKPDSIQRMPTQMNKYVINT
ncbi:unnamed protein product [Moneuplotes crassus]|uniref:Uncharacterized protein n=1 Tax=Euplotes crassus TaxID=5936 RepID=A0AAD1UN01_EUPCR|nr:unnamed protein product [Moneuplotes crassus]